jgi:hypothetical protein
LIARADVCQAGRCGDHQTSLYWWLRHWVIIMGNLHGGALGGRRGGLLEARSGGWPTAHGGRERRGSGRVSRNVELKGTRDFPCSRLIQSSRPDQMGGPRQTSFSFSHHFFSMTLWRGDPRGAPCARPGWIHGGDTGSRERL